MHFSQYIYDRVTAASIHTRAYDTSLISVFPFGSALADSVLAPPGIPCEDPFIQLIESGLGFFLFIMLAAAVGIGFILMVLGGLLRIAALTTQKEEDKKDRLSMSKLAFIASTVIKVPALIFFLLLYFLPYWFGLGDKTCQ